MRAVEATAEGTEVGTDLVGARDTEGLAGVEVRVGGRAKRQAEVGRGHRQVGTFSTPL